MDLPDAIVPEFTAAYGKPWVWFKLAREKRKRDNQESSFNAGNRGSHQGNFLGVHAAELRQLATQIVMLRDGRVTALGGVKVLSGTTA